MSFFIENLFKLPTIHYFYDTFRNIQQCYTDLMGPIIYFFHGRSPSRPKHKFFIQHSAGALMEQFLKWIAIFHLGTPNKMQNLHLCINGDLAWSKWIIWPHIWPKTYLKAQTISPKSIYTLELSMQKKVSYQKLNLLGVLQLAMCKNEENWIRPKYPKSTFFSGQTFVFMYNTTYSRYHY